VYTINWLFPEETVKNVNIFKGSHSAFEYLNFTKLTRRIVKRLFTPVVSGMLKLEFRPEKSLVKISNIYSRA
jgi:hypothetical protein